MEIKGPNICDGCNNKVTCRASVVIRKYGRPVETCLLNHMPFDDVRWAGVYERCEDVIRRVANGEAAVCSRFAIAKNSAICFRDK